VQSAVPRPFSSGLFLIIEQGGWRPGSGSAANAAPDTLRVTAVKDAAMSIFFTVLPHYVKHLARYI
jgi:hypothetical protein